MSLHFDGTNDLARDTATAGIPAALPLTVSGWIKPGDSGTVQRYIIHAGSSSTSGWSVRRSAADQIQYVHNGVGAVTFAPTIFANVWSFFAVVATTTDIRFYTWDAERLWRTDVEAPIASLNATNNKVVLGAFGTETSDWFLGAMVDVRVYSVARTQAEIEADYNKRLRIFPSTIKAYWRLNETSGTTGDDVSLFNNDLTLVNFALTGSTSNWISDTPVGEPDPIPTYAGTFPSVSVVDNFNRANQSLETSANWGAVLFTNRSATQNIVSQAVQSTSTSFIGSYWWKPATYQDVEVYVGNTTLASASAFVYLYARVRNPGLSNAEGYSVTFGKGRGSENTVSINSHTGTTSTPLAKALTMAEVIGGQYGFVVRGSTLKCVLLNPSGSALDLLSITDSTYPAEGHAGFGLFYSSSPADAEVDNFGVGAFVASAAALARRPRLATRSVPVMRAAARR